MEFCNTYGTVASEWKSDESYSTAAKITHFPSPSFLTALHLNGLIDRSSWCNAKSESEQFCQHNVRKKRRPNTAGQTEHLIERGPPIRRPPISTHT